MMVGDPWTHWSAFSQCYHASGLRFYHLEPQIPVRTASPPRGRGAVFYLPLGTALCFVTPANGPEAPRSSQYHVELRTQIASPLASLNALSVPLFSAVYLAFPYRFCVTQSLMG